VCVEKNIAACPAVRDALADERVAAVDLQAPPGDAAGEDDRPRAEHVAAVQVHLPVLRVEPGDRPRDEDLGPEPARLLERAARELLAGDSRREAEVVLDARGGPCLTAGRLALDHDRPQSLRGAVDGGREPRRPPADDQRVVLRVVRLGVEPEQLGDTPQLRADDRLAVHEPDDRLVILARQRAAPALGGIRRVRLQPRERDLVPVEEAAQLAAGRVPAAADDEGSRRQPLGGDGLQAVRAADPMAREAADLLPHVGLDREQRVVVVRLDPHHARALGRAEAHRERRAERDRHLAEDVARGARADHSLDPVDELDRVDRSAEHREERVLAAFGDGPLTRQETDVGRRARDPLPRGGAEVGEHLDVPHLLRRHHPARNSIGRILR
jgi:hypothetical protein